MSSTRSGSPPEVWTTLMPWPSQLCAAKPASKFDMEAYLKLLRQQRSKAATQTTLSAPSQKNRVQKSADSRPVPALRRSQRLRRATRSP